ncbi:MAG: hypothetical protein M0R77_03050 [Gammaproteobacteria bacterium]|nr:hypothetical protein [Gammaproteobacteria bacterium]
MADGYCIIRKQYFLSDYIGWEELEMDVFLDLKAYQFIAAGLGINIAFKADTILDSTNIVVGSGYLSKGKNLLISIPNDFSNYFTSDVIRQMVK